MAQLVDSVAASVAAKVKAERQRKGWSQDRLAARMREVGATSWHQTTAAKVEAVARPRAITLSEAVALAFALGLPGVDALLDGDQLLPALHQNFVERGADELRSAAARARAVIAQTIGDDAAAAFAASLTDGADELKQVGAAQAAKMQLAHRQAATDQLALDPAALERAFRAALAAAEGPGDDGE